MYRGISKVYVLIHQFLLEPVRMFCRTLLGRHCPRPLVENNIKTNFQEITFQFVRRIFGKWEGVETGWSWLRIGTGGGHL